MSKDYCVICEDYRPCKCDREQQIDDLKDENKKLRLELHTLRFKESQEQRFIWWVREVYAKKIQAAILKIKEVCTEDPETDNGWQGTVAYCLPAKCWEELGRIMESTNGIYDGTYLDVEVSTENKTSTDNNNCIWVEVSDPDIDLWCSSCGEEFHLETDTPSGNHMKCCCYCGKEITEG